MKIKMTQTRVGAPNGFTFVTFNAGETYEMTTQREKELGELFMRHGWAVDTSKVREQLKPLPEPETSPESAPESKKEMKPKAKKESDK